jgi:class 3 adenylate cyclase/predicted ATPase
VTPTSLPSRFASPEGYTPKHLAEKILNSRSELEGERKLVTVLFADLKGSMELLADRDPEEARKLLDPVLERMMEAVHRYEGTVNQVMGDGIMALFGAPVAHEDHAVRACYASLRMQEEVKRYAEEIQRSHGVPVQIRIGLNAGEVVVRSIGNDLHMDYTAVGQTTHLAARLEQVAMPGSILISADTVALAEGYAQVKPLGPVAVKGLDTPMEVYELLGVLPVRSRLEAAATRGLTPFVGRQREVETLRHALARAQAGHGQVVGVQGEPGVGKTRLFHEFTHAHPLQGWLCLETWSMSYGKATAYLPVLDLLKTYFQLEARDDARRMREKVTGKLLTLDPALQPTLPAFLALLDISGEDPQWQALDPSHRRQRTLEALKRLMLRESQLQPLCLVVENLHWIDTESQAWLDRLIESLPTARLLLLVNFRPEYQHGWGSKSYYTQLRLHPLPSESAEELLQALLGTDQTLQPLKRLLIGRTEGNPFFLEESVRTLVESQVLTGERGAYRLARALPSIQVPPTVQAVLAARIDRLLPEEKRLLQAAAVVGKDVPYPLLQAIAEVPEEALRRGLTHLQAAEFLYEMSLFPDLEYTFKHALTHQVVYGTMLQERKKILHERVVQAIERLYPDRLSEQVERLAHHAAAAGLDEKAVHYRHLAGMRASERSANIEAIAHLTTGLDLLGNLEDSPKRRQQELALRIALGPVLITARGPRTAEVAENYTKARELCAQLPESFLHFAALWGIWRVSENWRTKRDVAYSLSAVAERLGDPGLRLQAHHCLWANLFHLGQHDASCEHAAKGLQIYGEGDYQTHSLSYAGHDPKVCALGERALSLWLLGFPERSLGAIREAMAWAQTLAHAGTMAHGMDYRLMVHRYRGDVPVVRRYAEEMMAFGEKHDLPVQRAQGKVFLGWATAEEGELERGLALMHEGLEVQKAIDTREDFPVFFEMLAGAYARCGRRDLAQDLLAEILEETERTDLCYWTAELYRVRGEVLLSMTPNGEDESEGWLNRAVDLARVQQVKSLELRAAISLARLETRRGRLDRAQALLAPVCGWFHEGFDTVDLIEAKRVLDRLQPARS